MFEHIDFNYLLATYGYLAIFIGCLLEGETILILGGMAAHQHVLKLLPVIGYASLAGMLGDQLLFWLGRYFGARLLPRLHKQQAAIDRVTQLIGQYPTVSIFFGAVFVWHAPDRAHGDRCQQGLAIEVSLHQCRGRGRVGNAVCQWRLLGRGVSRRRTGRP